MCGTRWTIAETRELCGVAEQQCDLKARLVRAEPRLSREGHSRAQEQGLPSWGECCTHHPAQMALQRRMIDHLRVECNVLIGRIDVLKARPIVVGDFPIGGLGPSRAGGARPPVQVTQMGITPERADQVHLANAPMPSTNCCVLQLAIRDQILERLERLGRHDAVHLGQG